MRNTCWVSLCFLHHPEDYIIMKDIITTTLSGFQNTNRQNVALIIAVESRRVDSIDGIS